MIKPKRASLTRRTIAVFAGAVLIVQLIGIGVQYSLVKRRLTHQLEEVVTADVQGFAALYDQRRIIAVRQAIEFRLLSLQGTQMLLSLQDRDGVQLAGNLPVWPQDLAAAPPGPLIRFSHDGRIFVGAVTSLRGGFPLLVARDRAGLDSSLRALRRQSALIVLATLGMSFVAAVIASRLVMRRVRRINGVVDRVASGEISARPPTPSGAADEYTLLEQHIHAMLDKIEALTRATHHLSDTIAHELRTPLTRIQNRLAQLDSSDKTAAAAMEEMRQTIRIFDSLLQIAKTEAEQGAGLALAALSLSQLCEDMAELYGPLAEDHQMTLIAEIAPDLDILGDRNLVAQLIANLLDNAIKFCPAGTTITVTLRSEDTRHCLQIVDDGPGLPDGFSAKLFERFTRAQPDVSGYGLGMALVRAIAVRHGAKVTLPAVTTGFAIFIHWPRVVGNP